MKKEDLYRETEEELEDAPIRESDDSFFKGVILYHESGAEIPEESESEEDIEYDEEEYDPEEEEYEGEEEYDSGDEEYEDGDDEEEESEFDLTMDKKAGRKSAGGSRAVREKEPKKKRSSRKKRRSGLGRFLRILIILALVLCAGWYVIVKSVYGKMTYVEVASKTEEPYRQDGVTNILLIGNDARDNGEDGRSDAMILLSISNKTKSIQMISLLRDIYVEIPGHDGNRLNAAYAYGGPELLMETVEQNFEIPVNRYVQVNFEAFANLVEAAGGVDLELSNDEVQLVNGYLWEYNILTGKPEGTDYLDTSLSGMIHLNGPQALAYTRNRYIGTDFGRTERQRKVLSAVMKNLPKALIKNPKQLVDSLLPNLTTNLTGKECYMLSFQAGKLLTYDMEQGSVPVEGSYQNANIRGMAVLQLDFETNKSYLKEKIYGEE